MTSDSSDSPFSLLSMKALLGSRVRGECLRSGITCGISWETREKIICVERSIVAPKYEPDPWSVRLTLALPVDKFLLNWMETDYIRLESPEIGERRVLASFQNDGYVFPTTLIGVSEDAEEAAYSWIYTIALTTGYTGTLDMKVIRYLERSSQCVDGDTEVLGFEIVRDLAEFYAKIRNLHPPHPTKV